MVGNLVDDLFEITRPKTLPEILRALNKDGSDSLGTKKLKQVLWVDYESPEAEEDEEDEELELELEDPEGRNYVPKGSDAPTTSEERK